MKRVLIAGLLIALLSPLGAGVAAPTQAGIPVFSVSSVATDSTVTISGSNFLLNDTYDVLMGAYGTQAIGGTKVATQSTGGSSSFTATYSIPAALKGSNRIAIRLQSSSTGYFSYNWFYNNTSTGSTSGTTTSTGTSSSSSSSSTSSYLSVRNVIKNTSFVLDASGLPKNEIVRIRLTKPGANNVVLEKVNTGNKGTISQTFLIPSEIKKASTLVVSVESTFSDFTTSTSFTNPITIPPNNSSSSSSSSSSGSSSGSTGPIVGIPTFNITAVKKDTTVTISGVNFIPGDVYNVFIGAYGTLGIGGIIVDTQNAGSGSFTATYNIPGSLAGSSRLAIRLQSPTTGYFSYNWFDNITQP